MSLKVKLSCLLVVAMILNVFLVSLMYNIFFASIAVNNVKDAQNEHDQEISAFVHSLENCPVDEIEQNLADFAKKNRAEIELTDIVDGSSYVIGEHVKSIISLRSSAVLRANDRIFLVEITSQILAQDLSRPNISHYIMLFEMTLLVLVMLLVSASIYILYARPLVFLRNKMIAYGNGKKIAPVVVYRRDELGQLENSFYQLINKIDEEQNMRNQVIASIAHDIKTPLTLVMGHTERLINGKANQDRREEYLKTIYRNSLAINELIDEFDEYLGNNLYPEIDLMPFNVSRIIELSKEEYSDEVEHVGATYEVFCNCEDVRVLADISRLKRVVGNLVGNSIRHSAAEQLKITLSAEQDGDFVVFRHTDNGCGVKPEDIEKIFEPLFTSDSTRKVSGLGLSICRMIIDSHGGEIRAENTPEGFCVRFTLKIVK